MRDGRTGAWPGARRTGARALVLMLVTLGAYWPLWVAQVLPPLRGWPPSRAGRIGLLALLVIPGVNVAVAVLLALHLPRALRRAAERAGRPGIATEAQTFLLLAAPSAAVALALALGMPWWATGYVVWPLELPATLAVQGAVNRLPLDRATEGAAAPRARALDGEALASGAIAALLAIGLVLTLVLGNGGGETVQAPVSLPPAQVASDLAVTPGALWVSRLTENTVERIDPQSGRRIGEPVHVGRKPLDIANGFGRLWVADYESDSVSRIDPSSARIAGAPIETGRGPFGVATGLGSVWVTDEVDRNLVQIDPRAGKVVRKVPLGRAGPHGVVAAEGAVWVAGGRLPAVFRVDPRSNRTARVPVPGFCQDVAAGGGSIWAALPEANAVAHIDPRTLELIDKVRVGLGPASLEYGRGSVWVANGDGTVTRIDARSGRVRGKPVRVAKQVTDIAVAGREVWALAGNGTLRRLAR